MASTFSLYAVANTDTAYAQDIDQIVSALQGTADAGPVTWFAPIAAPGTLTAAPASGSGSLTGAYQWVVTFITGTPDGAGALHIAGETAAGTASTTVTLSAQNADLTAIPIGPTGTIGRRVYRTKAGGSTFYFDFQISDNTTTSWTDSTTDASLGAATAPTANTTGTAVTFGAGATLPSGQTLTNGGTISGGTLSGATWTGGAFAGTIAGTPTYSGRPTFSSGITGTGSTGSLSAGSGILGAANVWAGQQTLQNAALIVQAAQSGSAASSPNLWLSGWTGSAGTSAVQRVDSSGTWHLMTANAADLLTVTQAGAVTATAGLSATTGAFSGAVALNGGLSVTQPSATAVGATLTAYATGTADLLKLVSPTTSEVMYMIDVYNPLAAASTFTVDMFGNTVTNEMVAKGLVSLNAGAQFPFTASNTGDVSLSLDSNAGGTGTNAQYYYLQRKAASNFLLPNSDLGLFVYDGANYYGVLVSDYTDKEVGIGLGGAWTVKTQNNTLDDGSGAATIAGLLTASGGFMDFGDLGSARSGVTSSGTDAALAFVNTSTGGLTYWWDSGASGAGIGEGNFAVYSPGAAVAVPFGMNATTGKVYTSKNVLDDGSGYITGASGMTLNGGILMPGAGVHFSNYDASLPLSTGFGLTNSSTLGYPAFFFNGAGIAATGAVYALASATSSARAISLGDTTGSVAWINSSGDAQFAGTGAFAGNVTAPTFVGALSGNASTASSLGGTMEAEVATLACATSSGSYALDSVSTAAGGTVGVVPAQVGHVDGSATYYFEAAVYQGTAGDTVYAGLWDVTAGAFVSGSTVSTTSTTISTVLRSGGISLTAGHVYALTLWVSGATGYCTSARVVAQI